MTKTNSNIEQPKDKVVSLDNLDIYSTLPNNFTADSINFFTEKLKPSAIDWNQTINIEDSINKFYFNENDGVNFVDESQNLTSAAFSTTEDTTQPVISDNTIKFLGVQTYFHKGDPARKPQTRVRQEKLFTKLTGYTVDQLINNDIPKDVLKSSEFQAGINSFYEKNSDKITLADKNNLSINDTIALQASGLLWEIGTGMRTDIVTLPLLKKGPKGIAAYLGINFVSGFLNNLAAQRLRGETKISRGEGVAAGIVQMIPFGSTAKGWKGYLGAGGQGAATAGTEATIRTGIDEQRFLTKGELTTSLTFGTLFGTGFKGTADAFSAIVNKYQGKSAAEIDKLLTKKEKNIIDKFIEKTAGKVFAVSDDIGKFGDEIIPDVPLTKQDINNRINDLEVEWAIHQKDFRKEFPDVGTVGGIEPSSLPPERLKKYQDAVGRHFELRDEISRLQEELKTAPTGKITERLRGNLKNVAQSDAKALRETDELLKEVSEITGSKQEQTPIRVFHGTSSDNAKLIRGSGVQFTNKDYGVMGEGFYITPDKEYSKVYGPEVIEGSLPKSAKILDITDQNAFQWAKKAGIGEPTESVDMDSHIQKYFSDEQKDKIVKWAKDNNYDGIKFDPNPLVMGTERGANESLIPEIVLFNKDLANKVFKKIDDLPPKLDLTTDTRGKGEFYHGAADEFELDASGHFSTDTGIYGQGFYTTDDLTTAGKYQKKNRKTAGKDAKRTIYKVEEKTPVNFYDLDQPLDDEILELLQDAAKYRDGYVDEAIELVTDFDKKELTLANLLDTLRGRSEDFNITRSEFQEIIDTFKDSLREKGFGGFTHQGGKLAGKGKRLHQVKIYWDPQDQLNINKVDVGGGGAAVPPRKPPISQGDGPLKGTDTTPHQINPDQVSNTNEQFKLIVNRIKQLKTEGIFSQIKTTEDTVEGGIKMLADTNMLKEYARMYAKIYNLVPTDELNYALAEAVTLATQKTSDINQKLITAINVSKDPVAIKQNLNALIASIGEIDEWLRMGIPLRTEQARGMRSMQIETKGISPEDFAKLTAAEKYKLNMSGQSNINLDSSVQSLKLQDLKTKILDAFEIAQQTDDYSVLNKLLNTIERADGKVEDISALYESDVLHKIFSSWNKGNRIFNEIGINALLSAPTTNEINFLSGVLETYMSAYELIRGAGSRVELDAAIRHLIALHSNGSFVRKAFKQSFKTSDNYINRGALKADYKERFVISSDGKDVMSRFIDGTGKFIRFPSQLMTSVDALVQAPNLIAAIHYQGHIEGAKQGKKGEDLTKYIKGHLDAILEYYASNSGKGITDTVTSRILKNAQEFAKRSTFTENIRADNYIGFGKIANLLNSGANQVPMVRTLLSFVRAPTNIIKRQMRRTPGINLALRELRVDLKSVDPLVRNQAIGQMKVAKELGFTVAGLTFAGFLMEQNPNFVPPVILTGGGPDWKTLEGRKVWKNMLKNGWQPYSVGYLQKNKDGSTLIGEDGKPVYKYYSYARLDPLSSWIGLMVDFAVFSGVLTDDEYDEFTTGWVGVLTRNITDRSYLQQLDDAMKALSDENEGSSRTNFWTKQFADRTPYANFFRYAKQLPGDLLDIAGVPKDLSARFHQKRDTKLRAGDKLFGVFPTSGEDEIPLAAELRKLLNEYSETVPGFGGNLPFLKQHITNEPMLYPQRPGLDLFNWVKTSTSKNHPVFSALSIIGKELREPVDIINGSGTDNQIESFRLNTTEYAELRETVNTIKSQKYGGLNLDQALRGYFKTPHYKKNIAIVEERGALNADIAVKEIYSKLQSINNHFILLGENEWIRNQGTGKIQIQIQKKRNINNEYLNDLNNLSPD